MRSSRACAITRSPRNRSLVACRAEPGTRRVRPAHPHADAKPQSVGRGAPLTLPCQLHGPDLWFAEAPADLELAKALCTDCPARLECLAGALDRQEPFGVWGGQNCTLTLTAAVDGTSAAATSTASYVFITA